MLKDVQLAHSSANLPVSHLEIVWFVDTIILAESLYLIEVGGGSTELIEKDKVVAEEAKEDEEDKDDDEDNRENEEDSKEAEEDNST